MKFKNKFKNKLLSAFILASAMVLSSCSAKASTDETYLPEAQNDTIYASVGGGSSDLRVSFIDVGQGDSEFIELPNGETLLIDAGTNETGQNVTNYIKSLGYTSINYVVGTHPHEDHIGGLDDVINTFDVGSLYMPKVTADTQTFEDVLDAAESKGLMINTAKAGVTLVDSDGLSVKMLAPTQDSYDNTNDYSAVIKVVYDDTSFLFTGDAEEYSESLISGDVKADVLKVGHHGSSTSTSQAFLDRVSPSYAVISCGRDNSYGHPHSETLQKLSAAGVIVYRTDELGTITAVSDGKTITFDTSTANTSTAVAPNNTSNTSGNTSSDTQAVSPSAQTSSQETSANETGKTYVLNTNTKKIHLPECSSVDKMSESNKAYTDDYDKAIADGYEPCKICNP